MVSRRLREGFRAGRIPATNVKRISSTNLQFSLRIIQRQFCRPCRGPPILAAPRLATLGVQKSAALQAEVTQDAIAKAERIIRQIDARCPSNTVRGKT